ncbi:MAG: hypothetical protein M0Z78_08850 [Betaproteobacteria bacterium]|nr:hypothetical protein [Betaproteobacteria bacterium]
MALTYVKKFRVERLKLAINANHQKHGKPLPMSEVERLAKEFDVQAGWVRRIERRDDIDLDALANYRKTMNKAGVDADTAAGDRVCVGGKASTARKRKGMRERMTALLDQDLEVDLVEIAEEFGVNEKSNWPKIILCELEKERAEGEKRPVSPAQRELVIDILRSMGGDFGLPGQSTRHKEAVDSLLDRYSMAQIHKAIKNLYHIQKTERAMRSDFAKRVVRPLLQAVDFQLFR